MSTDIPREAHSRRTVITATATAATLVAIESTISACGRPGTASAPDPTSGAPPSGDVCARAIAQTGDIPVGGGKVYPDVPVIVGGAASYTAALHHMRTGAAGVLVGFGGGAAHTTRRTLGIHAPMASATISATS